MKKIKPERNKWLGKNDEEGRIPWSEHNDGSGGIKKESEENESVSHALESAMFLKEYDSRPDDEEFMSNVKNKEPKGWIRGFSIEPTNWMKNELTPVLHRIFDEQSNYARLKNTCIELHEIDVNNIIKTLNDAGTIVSHRNNIKYSKKEKKYKEEKEHEQGVDTVVNIEKCLVEISKLCALIKQLDDAVDDAMYNEDSFRCRVLSKLNELTKSARTTVVHNGMLPTSIYHSIAVNQTTTPGRAYNATLFDETELYDAFQRHEPGQSPPPPSNNDNVGIIQTQHNGTEGYDIQSSTDDNAYHKQRYQQHNKNSQAAPHRTQRGRGRGRSRGGISNSRRVTTGGARGKI